MTIQTASDGRLAKRDDKPPAPPSLVSMIENMKSEIARALPKHLSPDRMARIAVTALRTTPKLSTCTPASFLGAIMGCSVLGLEPNTPLGQAYLVPYWNSKLEVPGSPKKGGNECQLIIGYQGFLDLVRRSGLVASTQAFAVYDGDFFEYELGLNPKLVHRPSESAERENGKLTHAYCVVKLKDKDADPIFLVMPRAQIEKRRMRGASGKKYPDGNPVRTPWDTDYEAMALKTVVRAAIKWAPRSAEMAQAVDIDERAERGDKQTPALPGEVAQALLTSGHATEAEFEDSAPADETAPTREPGQEG